MSNDTYSAPVTAERQENLKDRTEELHDRMQRFLHHPLDSIEVHGLGEELEGLAAQFKAVSERSVDEHQDQTIRKYRVVVNSHSKFETEIECRDCDKWAVAQDTDGGVFTEIGEGTWHIQAVELVDE